MLSNTPVGLFGGAVICAFCALPLLIMIACGFTKAAYLYGLSTILYIFGAIMIASLFMRDQVFAPCVGFFALPPLVWLVRKFFAARGD